MSNSAIAIRYAKALLNIALEEKQVEHFSEELSTIAAVLKREDLLRLLLDSPTFPLEKKNAIMADIAAHLNLSQGMKNFLQLLLEKGRIVYLSEISAHYRRFADDVSGIVRANLTTANDLSTDKSDAIKKGLESQTGKKVILNVDIDPSLIGGVQAEMDGKIFDGSVKTQLKRMADTLAKG